MFGRFGGDKRMEGQKQKLAELEARLAATERAAANLPQLRQQFSEVWFDSPERDKAVERLAQARELLNLSHKIVSTKSFADTVDQNIEMLDNYVAAITVDVDAFTAILIGRQHLWNARGEGEAFEPSVRDSQLALHASASSLAAAVQEHIDELTPIRIKHQGPWPARLDLENLRQRVEDSRKALAIYEERFQSHNEALPPQSSITLLMIAQDMESAVDTIEYERPNLAMDTLMRGLLKNAGPK
jgi:hypothetical protein